MLAALAAVVLVPASAAGERSLELGLTDSVFADADSSTRQAWLDRARSARAGTIIAGTGWSSIAPASPPPGFDPRNPADPAYDFSRLDAAIRDAQARGFRILLFTGNAPAFAEGPNRPADFEKAPAGTWKPRPGAIEDFAVALARRYSGGFAPAEGGGPLPQVRHFQLWAEPNLSIYLTPQYKGKRPVAAQHYRKMITAFNDGLKSVDRRNVVVTGGTGPYGDAPGGLRTRPARFWREVLCLRGQALRPAKCPRPAKFDVLAHHPINVGRPRRRALNEDDVSTPDIGKLRRILRKAERSGRVGGPRRHAIWATEIWWDSKPPDPHGVPQARHARWLQESLYLLWKQRVSTVIWFQVRDQADGGNFASTFQTGLFERDGTPKLAYHGFRFPFVADRVGKPRVRVWGKAPAAGEVSIERKRKSGWKRVARIRAGANRVFAAKIPLRGRAKLRARQGAESSLTWRQK